MGIRELGNWEIGELGNWGIGKLGYWGIGELGNWEIGKFFTPSTQFPNSPIPQYLLYAAIALLLPALLINLGLIAFTNDEGIRALVALEMQISGDYITPTMFGEKYLNKPPLYNWILLLAFELAGKSTEFIARLPTIFFLLVFAYTIYYFNKKLTPYPPSSLPPLHLSFFLLTSGRILFWDSMLALIDICFSWVMYSLFMVIYQEGERERYGRLFTLAYGLAAIGFLMKGLPAVIFLGTALVAWFVWQRKVRWLWSWQHLGGMAIFALLTGAYYGAYARVNGVQEVFSTLVDESAKRTFVEHGFGQTLRHLLTFPFEIFYHFLPWTLLAACFFVKKARQSLFENSFLVWNMVVLVSTILPYWASVEVYPRYLFMHVPLLFGVSFFLYQKAWEERHPLVLWMERILLSACIAAVIAGLTLLFWIEAQGIEYQLIKIAFLVLSLTTLTWLFWKNKAHRLMVFVLVLLVSRIGFNWFVLPSRLGVECSTLVRQTTSDAIPKLSGEPLYVWSKHYWLQPITGYYFTRETGQILRRTSDNFQKGRYYLVWPDGLPPTDFEEIARVTVKWGCGEMIVVRLK